MNVFQQAELIIFDLDGTLYEDTAHFEYYAQRLAEQIPEDQRKAYWQEYKRMEAGQHIVTIGKVYDVVRDRILELDYPTNLVKQAWTWEGKPLSEEEITRSYPSPIQCDFQSMIAIGDGWWLPNVCARHFGAKDTESAYHATKEYMASDQFQLTPVPGLREALDYLKTKKELVLVTNSQPDDVERLLTLLNLQGLFGLIITDAKKPQYTLHHFSQLLKRYHIDAARALSIGDNFINEIAPAHQLGMKTIFIDMYNLDYPGYDGCKVSSIAETVEAMKQC
ncbi:HAD family hydrolase [Caldalkalibacillus thermarum]|nr:HAD family hydrolase [Caldalkalibacillus thermarum]